MQYQEEIFMPIITRIMERYTSKESSSVSYEIAGQLMEAALYCVKEVAGVSGELLSENAPSFMEVYKRGLEAVKEKVKNAGKMYNEIVERFQDYGCSNYRDTILKGLPEFFVRYDAEFKPQDHLLTLDYPDIRSDVELCGIDRIYQYLKNITVEKQFMEYFSSDSIHRLLLRVQELLGMRYLDNLADLVLFQSIGCIAARKSVGKLEITKEDLPVIYEQFEDMEIEEIEHEIRGYLHALTSSMSSEIESYFVVLAKDYAVRIKNSMEYHSLENLLVLGESE